MIAPRVGLFGTFDTGRYGDLLLPLIVEREMRRRLPAVSVSLFAPQGWRRGTAAKGGAIAEPFGTWSPARCGELAASFDLMIAAGDLMTPGTPENRFLLDFIEGLSGAWSAVGVPFDLDDASLPWIRTAMRSRVYLSVRDEQSRRRVEALSVDQDVHVVPDTRLLVAELFPRDVLERRLRQLRACGAYPEHGRPLVVHGTSVPDTASSLEVVFLVTTKDDEAAVREIGESRRSYVLDSAATVEDIAAAIAHGGAFAGSSPEFAATALAYGVPFFDPHERPRASDSEIRRLSLHFDRLAEIAERCAAGRSNADVADLQRHEIVSLTAANERLRNAHQALRERVAAERVLFAEAVNRSILGEVTAATLVTDRARLLRDWSDATYALATAEQRALSAEESAQKREERIEEISAENVRLRGDLEEMRGDLTVRSAELAAARHELATAREALTSSNEELRSSREENERHRLVLRTRVVSAALRVQSILARLRRK